MLGINSSMEEISNKIQPIITSRKSTSVRELQGTNTIKSNQKFVTPILNTATGQCGSCYTTQLLCCQQIQTTKKFRSVQTSETFKNISPSHLQKQLCHLLPRISHLPNSVFQIDLKYHST